MEYGDLDEHELSLYSRFSSPATKNLADLSDGLRVVDIFYFVMHVNCLENTDADEGGPGPGTYHLKPTIGMPKKTDPSFWQSPAYSLRPLTNKPDCVSSPGPAYKVDRITRYGRDTNAKVIIGILLNKKNIKNMNSPGPAAYLPCYSNFKRAPTPKILFPLEYKKETMITRPTLSMLRKNNKPSTSVIHSRKKGYTIKWRTKNSVGETGMESPGPAAYNPVNTDVYKYSAAPARTFGMRTWDNETSRRATKQLQKDNKIFATTMPCLKSCRTKFSFGVKHSPKCLLCVLPADNSF